MLIVAPIIDDKFTSGKQCWEDDEPNILENVWILGIDDTRVVIIDLVYSSTSVSSFSI